MIAKIILTDEVSCRIENLNLTTRKRLFEKYNLMVPYARHTPQFKLGRWDGKVNFFSIGGGTYNKLLEEIVPVLLDEGYEIDIEDNRSQIEEFAFEEIKEDTFSNITWPAGHPKEHQPVMLFDHQVNAINEYTKNLQSIQCLSTASGKTIITAILSKLVEPYGRTIVIVPNKDLVKQTLKDYENFGLDVGVYYGDQKDFGKTHTICTWQSLESIERQRRDKKREDGLVEFLEGVVAVIVDEAHEASAPVLKKMLTGPMANIPIRWAMTGTIPKDAVAQLTLKVTIGDVVNYVKASDLQEKGILASCNVNILQTVDNITYNDYQSEFKYLTTNDKRLDWIAETIRNAAKTGNTLVLVDRIKTGEELCKRLPEAVFIQGKIKQEVRQETYDQINDSDNKIIISIYKLAAVGLNLPRLFNLVLIEPGKSFVRVIQSIGRGIRKAKDKDHVEIYDVTSDSKYSKKHLTERKRYYRESNYPFKITKVNY